MSKFYDNSIVPNEIKRNYDVYDRVNELGIDNQALITALSASQSLSNLFIEWIYILL